MWPTSDMSSGDPIVIDATVYRSLGVLGLGCELLDAWRCVTINTIFDPPDGGEIGRIAAAIRRETSTLQHGSAASSLWGAATDQLASLILLLAQVDVVPPSDSEDELATNLASKSDISRAWRQTLGIGARRIDSGEAACLAVAITRSYDFATDDRPAAGAFTAMTGQKPRTTFDALDEFAAAGRLNNLEEIELRLLRLRGPVRPAR